MHLKAELSGYRNKLNPSYTEQNIILAFYFGNGYCNTHKKDFFIFYLSFLITSNCNDYIMRH